MNPWKIFGNLVLLAGLGTALTFGQHVTYQSYGRDQGLTNLVTTAITEDSDGFLWVGTDAGVFRYDGSRFEHMGHEAGLPEGDISPMFHASDGTIWVGSAQGLFYGGSNGFYPVDGVKLCLGLGSPTQLAEWKAGELLVIAAGHLYLVQKENSAAGSNWKVKDSADLLVGLPRELKVSGVRPKGNTLWLGCGEEICRWQSGKFTRFGKAQGVPKQVYYGMRVSLDGSFWARSVHGLIQMDTKGKWHDRTSSVGLPSLTSRFPFLAEDTQGQLVLVAGSTIAVLTEKGWGHFSTHEGLPDVDIATIYFAEGRTWLGTQGSGLLRLKGYGRWKNYTKIEGLPSNTVWQMSEDSNGNLLAATNSGIARKLKDKTEFSPVSSVQERPCVTYGLAHDQKDRIWSTCEMSVYRYDTKTHERLRYMLPDVVLYLQPVAGKMWIATAKGLFTANIEGSAPEVKAVAGFTGQRIGEILPDGKNGAWIAASSGIFHVHAEDQAAFEVISGRKYSVGFAFALERNEELWFTSREFGIYRTKLDGDRAQSIELVAQPMIHSRQIYSLLADKRGWIWCGGDAGIDVYRDGDWTLLNSASGLITDDPNSGALLESSDGSIWIGTSQGVSQLLAPETVSHSANHSVDLLSVSIEDVNLPLKNEVDVPSGSGMVKIHLGTSEHDDEADLRLMYRIPGILNRWEEVQENYIRLHQSIPQKAHIEYALFRDDGSLVSSVHTMLVKIHPAWWRSDEAKLAYGLALLAWIMLGWKVRERRLQKRQAILEEIVASRTAEIAETNRALEQARVQLEFEATHDSLTGLMNRSAVLRDLNKEVERCRRDPKILAAAILDLDHFKQVNDKYGHAAGDIVLVEASRRMSISLRSYDILGRFGGEEFVIAFPDIEQQSTGARLEEIRTCIVEKPFNVDVALIHVTVSIGYAHWKAGDSVAELLKRADEALYRAKNEGRNRVCFIEGDSDNSPVCLTQRKSATRVNP